MPPENGAAEFPLYPGYYRAALVRGSRPGDPAVLDISDSFYVSSNDGCSVLPPSAAPTQVRRARRVILDAAIYSGEEFLDANSHQTEALAWVESLPDSSFERLTDDQIVQMYALAAFYYATFAIDNDVSARNFGAAPYWINDDNWVNDSGLTPCQ